MTITAQMVKDLREKTGAPMMDCKNALTEANGDLGGAEIVLRKKGIATAAKRAGRSAQEGLVSVVVRENAACMVEINCETDFVAKTDDFQELLSRAADAVIGSSPGDVGALLAAPFGSDGVSFKDAIGAKVGKLGENIVLRRFVHYRPEAGGLFGAYVHHGKIGVLVEAAVEGGAREASDEVVKDIAMHIAASDPRYLRRDEVDQGELAKEREIQLDRARGEGKPEKVLEKIVEGRLGKFYEENCLLEQPFVRDNNVSVTQWLASRAADAGKVTVRRFTRFKVGEGITTGA